MSFDPTLFMEISLVSIVVALIGYFIDKYVYISPSKFFGFLLILILVAISASLLILFIAIIWLYVTGLT